jgi:hypothetical protein
MFRLTIILLVILGLSVPTIGYADNCNVAPIKKNAPAPCDGFYFNKDAEKQAETYRDDVSYYKALSDKLTDRAKTQDNENAVLEQRLKLYMDETQSLSKDIATHDSNETWIRLGYFVLGVVGTGLVVRNLRQ